MHSKSDNIETMINDKTDEFIEELFQSVLTMLKGTDFIYDCVHLLYYKCHK